MRQHPTHEARAPDRHLVALVRDSGDALGASPDLIIPERHRSRHWDAWHGRERLQLEARLRELLT